MAKTQRRNRKGAAPRKTTAAVKRRARAAGARPAAKLRATARKAVKTRPAAKKALKPVRRAAAKARPAAPAAKKTVARKATAARRLPGRAVKKAVKKAAKKVATPAARKAAAPKKGAVAVKTPAVVKKTPVAMKKAAAPKKVAAPPVAKPARKAPALDRERRTVGEPEMVPMPPSSLVPGNASAARSGADELRMKMATHTGAGPVLTAGDVDADWGAAEAVGDEAPGGDNPTPDQDVVDEIGRALGVEYDDDEELQGGDEIAGRDRDRWELDPASSDDFDER
jgi:hypothetical protein